MSIQLSRTLSVLIFSPKKFLIWADAIVNAAAAVKPVVTGNEMKSTKNPANKTNFCLSE